MILLIANFFSSTYNLKDYLNQTRDDVTVGSNTISDHEVERIRPDAIVISPGPNRPEHAGNILPLIGHFAGRVPILGICLGHQAIGMYYGAGLGHSVQPRHGKRTSVWVDIEDPIFQGINSPTVVTRYNSLTLTHLPDGFNLISEDHNGEIMAIRHQNYPIIGLQFHPEAILTENGLKMLYNWKSSHYGLTT